MSRISTYIFCLFLIFSNITAQKTGYTELCEGNNNFTAPASFVLEQSSGILSVEINKESSKTWQGFGTELVDMVDITSKEIVNLRLKADTPMLLSVQIFDGYYVYTTRSVKIYPSEDFVDYCIDFTGSSSVDKKMIKKILLTPNGNTIEQFHANLQIDEIKLGTDAQYLASAGAVSKKNVFTESKNNKLLLLDIDNSQSISIIESGLGIENIQIGEIINKQSEITFDCKESFIGSDYFSVSINGIENYENNEIKIPINIEGNNTPFIESITGKNILAGDTVLVSLKNITDGNSTVEQNLIISATSNNQEVLPDSNITVDFNIGESVGKLRFSCNKADSNIIVTIKLDDQYSVNSIYETSFLVNSFNQINNKPEIDAVFDKFIYIENGESSISLSGISDGDADQQNLSFSFESGNSNIVPNADISVEYVQGSSEGLLKVIPKAAGTTRITISVADDGGNNNNNGNQLTEISFNLEVGNLPKNGDVADFSSFDNWGRSFENGQQYYELGTFHGKENVLKITLNDKACWTGTIYNLPELNLDKHRYMSYEIYFEGKSFEQFSSGKTHAYFYDDGWDADINRNVNAAHDERMTIPIKKWGAVFLDFRKAGGLDNNNGEEINVARIKKVLLNYASDFTWPFPIDDGTVYIANLKVGDAVPDSLIPVIPTKCTINPVANQVVFSGDSEQTIHLTGIGNGKTDGIKPLLTIAASDTTLIEGIVVSEIDDSGKAFVNYTPKDLTGKTSVSVTVSANDANAKTIVFVIDVIDKDITKTVDVELFPGTGYQTMQGFGTFYFPSRQNYTNIYTDELGASAVRIGLISNQIEPVNDNDDPNVLNLSALNYDAFDFDYLRRLKENGVENFILTSWSPPAWMKKNMSVDYGYASAPNYAETDNILEPYYYDEFAESMVAVVKILKNEADIDLYAIGIQNEPAFNEPYASAVLSPDKFADLVGIVGERFEREGITTKLYMPEQVFSQSHYSMAQYINVLIARPESEKYVDIIATHAYGEDGIKPGQPSYPGWVELWSNTKKCQNPKELWMSETFPECKGYDDAFSLAGAIHGAIKFGNISFWTLWDIEGTLMKTSKKLESFYTSQNYYKFIRPGARRIKAESLHEDIMVTSFNDYKNNMLTTVVINKNSDPLTIRLLSKIDSIPSEFDVYTTARNMNFVHRGSIEPNSTLSLPAKSITTLVGYTDGEMVVETEQEDLLPDNYKLYQNYPNPFNPTTTIKYSLSKSTKVKLAVFDILGRRVEMLVDQNQSAGNYNLQFNASRLSSGVYFYRIITNEFVEVKKMILIK
ncbi:MAG: T9SS type A sorting domain-containing protein [Melioribacteraceae bacterium]|nr:T9SS type A sorting domain-containing protein [Melioribacteraceae bacterium]